MKHAGELVQESDYAFAFRVHEPRPSAPRALLVLLHGVGGDEDQLASLAARVPDDVLAVLPRGPRSIRGDRLGWFREGLSDDGPQVVEDEAEDSRLKLVAFLEQLQHRFDLSPARTVVGGFSQGGMLAASAALTEPHRLAGFAMLCGRLMPELAGRLAPVDELASLRALLVHGRRDDVLPVGWAERARDWLERLRIEHELYVHDAAHELVPAMEDDFLRWFLAAGQPWNPEPRPRP